jgi:hypothetical protein
MHLAPCQLALSAGYRFGSGVRDFLDTCCGLR